MKLIFVLIALVVPAFTEDDSSIYVYGELMKSVTCWVGHDSVCLIRGHVYGRLYSESSTYCPKYVQDFYDKTIEITPNCNETCWKCTRCGRLKFDKKRPDTVVLWRRYKH
jgi:hypothetical protein